MKSTLCCVVVCLAIVSGGISTRGDEQPAKGTQAPSAKGGAGQKEGDERIDFARARQLLDKSKKGEKLSPDEQAYLDKAKEARRKSAGGASRALPAGEKTGLQPLTEMTADDRYEGQDGGLYGSGKNSPPEAHARAAAAESAKIEPLDASGKPASNGTIALISISMSNATQEFSTFKRLADSDPDKSPRVTIVDCAQGGQAMAEWVNPDAPPWREADRRLEAAKVSPQQVQIAWVKLANKGPTGSLEEHGKKLQRDTQAVVQNAKARFPNLRIVYLGSRIYGGYAQSMLNPEPYAYESAFAVRWLIQDQIKGEPALNYDRERGEVRSAVLLWGPYFWGDGMTPRKEDGLVWQRADLANDGTHPTNSGRAKVAGMLLSFFKQDPLAKAWFVKSEAKP